jgi:integral membrane protein
MNVSPNPITVLRKVALAEGVSFLVLLLVAMPLKYLAGKPVAVLIAGSIHGVLFLTLCFLLWRTMRVARWNTGRAATVFIASLLPAGPFILDRRLRAYEAEFRP